jgi:hypothetical protein
MQERHLRRGLAPPCSIRFKNSIWRSENLTLMDLPNLTPPIDGLGLCDGDWPIPTGFGRSIDVIDSFEKHCFQTAFGSDGPPPPPPPSPPAPVSTKRKERKKKKISTSRREGRVVGPQLAGEPGWGPGTRGMAS